MVKEKRKIKDKNPGDIVDLRGEMIPIVSKAKR
jgi:hypothetical protein